MEVNSDFSSFPVVSTASSRFVNTYRQETGYGATLAVKLDGSTTQPDAEAEGYDAIDDYTYNFEIERKTIEYLKSILNIFPKVEDNQLKNLISLIKNIVRLKFNQDLQISRTNDDEVQFFTSRGNRNIYLLVDEFGGIAFNKIGAPGKGYSATYVDADDLDQRKIIDFAYEFTGA